MRNLRRIAIAAALFLVVGSPRLAAQDNLNSSMSAYCVLADCSQVKFSLDVFGHVIVKDVTMQSLDPNLWLFDNLVSVVRRNGTDATSAWTANITNNQLTFSAQGWSTPEPIHFTINMQPGVGVRQVDLIGNLTYQAAGTYDGNRSMPLHGITDPWVTNGTVVPEPSTLALMAMGLLSLGFVARRRRSVVEDA